MQRYKINNEHQNHSDCSIHFRIRLEMLIILIRLITLILHEM